ncbi:MAG: U32 family peptidase [Gemmatimonadetes bacterium]|nr:U32 family peptidase [Gemmatimonadota bacterium]
MPHPVPELLSPAGTLDAVRAALANGANAVYLGAERFNARDDGAQLTLEEVGEACRLAHARGARVYLTFNILFKPAELSDALAHLGECVDRGIDAAIVQDLGAVRLIQRVYPGLEIHGSTQMTVHDGSGARVLHDLGVDRVVLARENTLEDIRSIRAMVPGLGLESFIHGALCIAYSGQCYMSGMISERSANRGACAQSCRKDYVLTDVATGAELDRGYLISAKDLAAGEHLDAIAEAGIGCLKIEGRKKKPEYVATVTRTYRDFLDRLATGHWVPPSEPEIQPLVQIFSRGFTGGMYGGRAGREYITRDQPDNRGAVLGHVTGHEGRDLLVTVTTPIGIGDGLGFEHPAGAQQGNTGFAVSRVRTVRRKGGRLTQAINAGADVPVGWVVVRSAQAELMERARSSFAMVDRHAPPPRVPLDFTVAGMAGAPLGLTATAGGERVTLESSMPLAPAGNRPLDEEKLREQLGRLGETPFVLGRLDRSALADGLFLPVSALNDLRQAAVAELASRRDWAEERRLAARARAIEEAVAGVDGSAARRLGGSAEGGATESEAEAWGKLEPSSRRAAEPPTLTAEVWRLEDAIAAAEAGATEVSLDLFLRHPTPPVSRVRKLGDELAARGVTLRLRTPTIVRPEERKTVDKWLALGTPLVSGHLGLVAELAAAGRDVVADYAVNCFNQHTAAELFRLGARRIVLSIELTGEEMAQVAAPWAGAGFEVYVQGRPEGMTIEHCVLSAAFEREPATCRDLCVQKYVNVELTDPAGYVFPVATDSACRNRLLHSRTVSAAAYLPQLWRHGFRHYRLVFNLPGDPVAEVTAAWRGALNALERGTPPDLDAIRQLTGSAFTRGHFARAV